MNKIATSLAGFPPLQSISFHPYVPAGRFSFKAMLSSQSLAEVTRLGEWLPGHEACAVVVCWGGGRSGDLIGWRPLGARAGFPTYAAPCRPLPPLAAPCRPRHRPKPIRANSQMATVAPSLPVTHNTQTGSRFTRSASNVVAVIPFLFC